MMRGDEPNSMTPWYRGFQGTIEVIDKSCIVTGKFKVLSNTDLEITELPVGKWTRDYK